MADESRYAQIIEMIFLSRFKKGMERVDFERAEFEVVAKKLKMVLPKNLGDLVYSFRYRASLPQKVQATATKGRTWIIRPAGRAKYAFVLQKMSDILPDSKLLVTKIPDSTPGIVAKYAMTDEQGLLAKLRYNRLIDIFTGVTCFSLQNHLRTTVPGMGQVETDEIYVGVDKRGAHFVFPVQAKGGTDRLNVVQIEQDFGVCKSKFPDLICRPVAAQFLAADTIALFEFEEGDEGVGVSQERHYRLVQPDEVTDEDLRKYGVRSEGK